MKLFEDRDQVMKEFEMCSCCQAKKKIYDAARDEKMSNDRRNFCLESLSNLWEFIKDFELENSFSRGTYIEELFDNVRASLKNSELRQDEDDTREACIDIDLRQKFLSAISELSVINSREGLDDPEIIADDLRNIVNYSLFGVKKS